MCVCVTAKACWIVPEGAIAEKTRKREKKEGEREKKEKKRRRRRLACLVSLSFTLRSRKRKNSNTSFAFSVLSSSSFVVRSLALARRTEATHAGRGRSGERKSLGVFLTRSQFIVGRESSLAFFPSNAPAARTAKRPRRGSQVH